jgi:hypothetical protein
MPEKRNRSRRHAGLLLAVALSLAACGWGPQSPPRPRNVIFILVDTLRADRLSSYGYGRSTSPNAVRPPCTFPSVNSMLTSRWPNSLFDLVADPGETKDVLANRRRDFARLRTALNTWLAASEGKEGLQRSREAEEKLRSLGYIQQVWGAPSFDTRPDLWDYLPPPSDGGGTKD